MAEVPLVRLNTATAMPALGFGTWKLSDGNEAKEAVSAALEAGYRLIDTARIYGNERSVGQAVRESDVPREEIFITTKLWDTDQGYDSATEAFEGSMERLGLEYVDLYLIHWPTPGSAIFKKSWEALSELYNEAQIKAAGVSNFEVGHLEDLISDSSLVPAVNQIEFHPFNFAQQEPVLQYCHRQGIAVQAYSPLAKARHMEHEVIAGIARRLSRTNAQVMIRWAIQHGTVPIPKSSHAGRIKENFAVFDFELTSEDMESLNSLGAMAGAF